MKIDDISKITDIITCCYSESPETITMDDDYTGTDLNECVANIIKKMNDLKDIEFHTFEENGELVGYFGILLDKANPFLWTFFIRPKYRNSELVSKVWKEIEGKMPKQFMSGVYTKNIKARKFLKRYGGNELVLGNLAYFKFDRS